MVIASLILVILGIVVTGLVALLVDKKTTRILNTIKTIQTSEMTPEKYKAILRLIDDAERSGVKRARINKKEDGSWALTWDM